MVPPLRDRREDIPRMVDHFLRMFTRANISPVQAVGAEAMEALVQYSWPGNVRELENVVERLVVVGRKPLIDLSDLPAEVRSARPRSSPMAASPPPKTVDVVDHLYSRLVAERESFWTAVYPLYMQREITRTHVREVVQKGLEEARGNYKIMVQLFNMETRDYKKFLNFLRKHQCQLPFKEYRQVTHA